jgi:putative thioredoxin
MVNNPQSSPALHGAIDLSGLVRKHQAPAPGAPAPGGTAQALVREVDDQSIGELVELSKTVPVVLEIYGGQLTPQLGPLIETFGGRFVLGTVRGESAPELIAALGVQGIPTVIAVVGGQPVPLFQGIPPEEEIRAVLDQVLALAAKGGVTGVVNPGAPEETPEEPPLPPLHQEAYDALTRNDFDAAQAAFQKALAQNPADSDAEAGLAQVLLLQRVSGLDAAVARTSAADDPKSVDAALAVADLDISGGHVEDACARLLNLYAEASPEDKERLRERLLSYFVLAGAATDAVKKARNRLTSLMF